ncbi:MAG: hypothetical protein C0594_02460 [Marinilabiliales bacterium]|nr:MAG: hypothetical protein C0594_02460 [Marinilabiliales bacterium]
MDEGLLIASFTLLFLYLLFIVLLWFGWRSRKRYNTIQKEIKGVTVLVPFRNEKENLSSLLLSFENQCLNESLFEVIFIDDHSDDGGKDFLINNLSRNNMSVLSLDQDSSGKKAALELGLSAAKNSHIITTDADCYHSEFWLESMYAAYCETGADLLLGPVMHTGVSGFISGFDALDFASLGLVTAGSAGLKKAFLANGANLMVAKEYYNSPIYEKGKKLASGDDVYILEAVKRAAGKVVFCKEKKALVLSKPSFCLSSFVSQRTRWLSKMKVTGTFSVLMQGGMVVLVNTLVLVFFLTAFFINPIWFYLYAGVKMLTEFVVMFDYLKYFGKQKMLNYFPLAYILYPVYLLILVSSSFIGRFEWKGRQYKV